MICMDLKIAKPNKEGPAFWRTIGTVFVSDESVVIGQGDKPATFVIDYPACSGIIVLRQPKKEAK